MLPSQLRIIIRKQGMEGQYESNHSCSMVGKSLVFRRQACPGVFMLGGFPSCRKRNTLVEPAGNGTGASSIWLECWWHEDLGRSK